MPELRVAYIEDNDAMRYATSRILREGGFVVSEADTGAEGLRLVRTPPLPDLIVLDIHLPDMSGFEVCRELKADPATASIPVLHLSSTYQGGEHVAQGLEGGADAYLTHPAEPKVLLATIRALLRAGRAEYGRMLQLIEQTPEVVNAFNVTGEDHWILEIAVIDVEHLDAVVTRFSLLTDTCTAIVLNAPREQAAVLPARRENIKPAIRKVTGR